MTGRPVVFLLPGVQTGQPKTAVRGGLPTGTTVWAGPVVFQREGGWPNVKQPPPFQPTLEAQRPEHHLKESQTLQAARPSARAPLKMCPMFCNCKSTL